MVRLRARARAMARTIVTFRAIIKVSDNVRVNLCLELGLWLALGGG